ncbi:MAG: hypothetical protein E4H08_07415 [Candidatus Atribacteria bacterium]|nr:MAG: hypothetical protein E4H08_07415 [Candidatus Atribacteria bacterium]
MFSTLWIMSLLNSGYPVRFLLWTRVTMDERRECPTVGWSLFSFVKAKDGNGCSQAWMALALRFSVTSSMPTRPECSRTLEERIHSNFEPWMLAKASFGSSFAIWRATRWGTGSNTQSALTKQTCYERGSVVCGAPSSLPLALQRALWLWINLKQRRFMNRQGILDFVRKHPTAYMATVEESEPRVRAMQTAHIDDEGLTFCTGVHKDVAKQLQLNPSV